MAKKTNLENLASMSIEAIQTKASELKAQIVKEKFDLATTGSLDANALRIMKKDVARLLTEISSRKQVTN